MTRPSPDERVLEAFRNEVMRGVRTWPEVFDEGPRPCALTGVPVDERTAVIEFMDAHTGERARWTSWCPASSRRGQARPT